MAKTELSYSDKLKSPKWQKKRLEIMSRDKFSCKECKANDKPLHVHHKGYEWGNDPWDYVNTNFITLCEDCHAEEEAYKAELKGKIHDYLLFGHTAKSLFEYLTTKDLEIKALGEEKFNG